jgi:hypothetical protein
MRTWREALRYESGGDVGRRNVLKGVAWVAVFFIPAFVVGVEYYISTLSDIMLPSLAVASVGTLAAWAWTFRWTWRDVLKGARVGLLGAVCVLVVLVATGLGLFLLATALRVVVKFLNWAWS